MTTKQFGERVKRYEDNRLIRGEGCYTDDVARDGLDAYSAAVVRSPHAHARITNIDVTDALEVPGLVAIYTYDDLTGPLADPLPLLIPHPSILSGVTQYALAKDEVNYVGEAIAFVIGTDRYAAEDAAEKIEVSYEYLTPVVGIPTARAAVDLVHQSAPGNIGAHFEQQVGDIDAALASAAHTLSFKHTIERSACTPMEGRAVHARWDAVDHSLRVYTSTQASTSVRAAIAAKLALDLSQVEVIAPDVGGGFGVKIVHPWPEELLTPMAAIALGRPVKYTEDRREHFIAAAHERAQEHEITVGYDDNGVIMALDVHIWHDHGAYMPYGVIVPIITSTQLLGPYKPGAYRCIFDSLYTNTVIVTPYRGAGRPQGVFAIERTMDRIADDLGLDRTVVRAANFIQPDEFPYDHGLIFQDGRPLIYDSGDYPQLLSMLKGMVEWDSFDQRRRDAAAQGKLIGLGIGCYVEGTGVGPYEGGHVQVETNGKVKVSTGLTSQGQGHQTAFAQIVADELGVPIEMVEVTTGDTRRFPYAVGTFASRAAVMSGNAIALAARVVRAKAIKIAAEAMEAAPEDLEIVDGFVRVKGSPDQSMALQTVAVLSNPLRYAFDEATKAATQFGGQNDPNRPPIADDEEPGLEGRDYYSPIRSTFAAGMHAAIVQIDAATSEISILKYAVVHDCGNVLNPMIVEGQIHGGVAQGVGGALFERMAYDEYGQLQNASFMDFLMPYATEIPTIEADHLQTPSPLNPLGIKGAGEAGVIPVSAAIASAIEDALDIRIAAMLFRLRNYTICALPPPLIRTCALKDLLPKTSILKETHREDCWRGGTRSNPGEGLGGTQRSSGVGPMHPGLSVP